MEKIDVYKLRTGWGLLNKKLNDQGYCLRRGECFEELEKCIAGSTRPELTEHFSTKQNTYTPRTAFWISVETHLGEAVGRVATRIDRLQGMTLVDYWRKYWQRCYPGEGGGQANLAATQPNFGGLISGNVAYIGDLYIEPEHRKNGIASALVKIVQLDALDEWEPDFVYGWMTREHVASPLFPSYGFRAVHTDGIRWNIPPGTIDDDLVFVGNRYSDLDDLLSQITTS
ncbi:hypothetical protein LP7551_02093 [Roseibium album]|nr:hypothetical protein LP7551_02093 [Roseibium album]